MDADSKISSLFNNEMGSDIKLILKDEIFHAHGSVLLIRCPKLYDEARGTIVGSSSVLMDSYPIEPLKEFLSLIYTGKCNVTEENYEEILKLVGKFKPPSADLCNNVQGLLKKNELPDLLNRLQIALDNHVDSLVDIGIQIIGKTFSKVLKSDELQVITKELFVEILTKTDVVCDDFTGEMEVFEAVLKYIKQHDEDDKNDKDDEDDEDDEDDKDDNDDDQEDLKAKLIPLVRYPTLNFKEFSECFKKLPELADYIKDPELVFFEISGVECKNSGFYQKKRLNEEVVNVQQETSEFDLNLKEQYTGYISRVITVMEINEPIVITQIGLYCVVNKDVTASIKIKNRHGIVLTTGTNVLAGGNGKWSKIGVNLSPLIQLNPKKQYFIHIEYDEQLSVKHFRNKSTESTIKKSMENVEIKLDNFNRMIATIVAFRT